MAECIASCDSCSACGLSALEGRIDALEAAVKSLKPQGFLTWLVEHATEVVALGSFLAALWVLALVLTRYDFRSLRPKSATLALGGSSVTLEAAAQEIGAFLASMQDYVVDGAASNLTALRRALVAAQDAGGPGAPGIDRLFDGVLKGLSPAAPERFATLPEPQKTRDLTILWLSAAPEETSRFARTVIGRMGNHVDLVGDAETALARLRSGLAYDLAVIEVSEPAGAGLAPLALARQLIDGVAHFDHLDPVRETRVGPGFRLAVLAQGAAKAAAQAQLDLAVARLGEGRRQQVEGNYLVVDRVMLLRGRIAWLQKQGL